jgi:hypothetical protein
MMMMTMKTIAHIGLCSTRGRFADWACIKIFLRQMIVRIYFCVSNQINVGQGFTLFATQVAFYSVQLFG